MELSEYFQVVRKRWRALVLSAAIGLLLGVGLAFTLPAEYRAQTQLFVAPDQGATASDLLQGSNFAQSRVKSYLYVIDSETVLGPVIDQLQLDTDPLSLAGKVTATAPVDTVMLVIDVVDHSPQRSADIANAVATRFTTVAKSLEPRRSDNSPIVAITVVQPATPPLAPEAPDKKLYIGLGFLVGIAIGFGLAIGREVLNRRIHTEDDIKAVRELPVIGHVPAEKSGSTKPLLISPDSHGPMAEAIRQLRTNLQFLDVEEEHRSYVITSTLPGEGKTVMSANLAIALSEVGLTVCFLEADLRRPTAARFFDLEGSVGLTSVLIGAVPLTEVMQPWGSDNMQVILSGPIPPNPSELLLGNAMGDVIAELEAQFDAVVIDSPPLLPVTDAAVLAKRCAGAIIVVAGEAKAVHRDQFERSLTNLENIGARILGVVLNRLPSKGRYAYLADHYRYISDLAPAAKPVEEQVGGQRVETGKLATDQTTESDSETKPAKNIRDADNHENNSHNGAAEGTVHVRASRPASKRPIRKRR